MYLAVSDGGTRLVLEGATSKTGALSSSFTLPDGSTFRRTEVYLEATNNQMELLGMLNNILLALKFFLEGGHRDTVCLASDSQLVIKGICEGGYLEKWRQNGFRTYSSSLVANYEIWILLDQYLRILKSLVPVQTYWIRGHLTKDEVANLDDPALKACAMLNIKCDSALGEALETIRSTQDKTGCLTVEDKLQTVTAGLQDIPL